MLLTPSSLILEGYIFKSWQVIQSPINNFKWCSPYYCANVSPGIYPRVNGIKSQGRQAQCPCDQEYLGVPNTQTQSYNFPPFSPYCHWQTEVLVGSWWARTGGRKRAQWHTAGTGWESLWLEPQWFKTIHCKTKSLSINRNVRKWLGLLTDKVR